MTTFTDATTLTGTYAIDAIKGVTKPVTVEFEYTGTAVDPHDNTRR